MQVAGPQSHLISPEVMISMDPKINSHRTMQRMKQMQQSVQQQQRQRKEYKKCVLSIDLSAMHNLYNLNDRGLVHMLKGPPKDLGAPRLKQQETDDTFPTKYTSSVDSNSPPHSLSEHFPGKNNLQSEYVPVLYSLLIYL